MKKIDFIHKTIQIRQVFIYPNLPLLTGGDLKTFLSNLNSEFYPLQDK